MTNLLAALDARLHKKKRAIIAIDGMCAAGKSTLADALVAHCDANVFHMDDFFLPAARKTPSRLAEPGGNVDYERFYAEVLAPLMKGEAVAYRRFDCHAGALCAPVRRLPKTLEIVEGVYSTHPHFGEPYDFKVFLQVDEAVQRARIRARSGEAMLVRFEREWIPLEHAYFDACATRERCDLIL